jgi:hypothetical protein
MATLLSRFTRVSHARLLVETRRSGRPLYKDPHGRTHTHHTLLVVLHLLRFRFSSRSACEALSGVEASLRSSSRSSLGDR